MIVNVSREMKDVRVVSGDGKGLYSWSVAEIVPEDVKRWPEFGRPMNGGQVLLEPDIANAGAR